MELTLENFVTFIAIGITISVIIWKFSAWKTGLDKEIDSWRGEITKLDQWKKEIDSWRGEITKKLDQTIDSFSEAYKSMNPSSKDSVMKSIETLGEIIKSLTSKTNPISAEEREKFNSYRKKVALGEAFTIEEYRDFKFLAEKISKELTENEKEIFDSHISDLLNFILGTLIERIIVQPGANLEKANFMVANLQEVNLERADLTEANLREADLTEANLTEANLMRTDLRRANLEKANLFAANLQEVNLEGANLSGADLRRANLEKANLTAAKIDEKCLETILKSNNWIHAEFDPDVKKKLEDMSKQYSAENNVVRQEVKPTIAIPADDPIGITSSIKIAKDKKIKDIMVWVDITHTWIGDLTIDLISPTGTSVRLHDRAGASQDNIKKTYTIQNTPSIRQILGENVKGEWALNVADHTPADIGTLNHWGLEINLEKPL